MTTAFLLELDRIPKQIKGVFHRASQPSCAAQNLWREVAARAVLDAMGVTGLGERPKHVRAQREARIWFKFFPDDVREVFDMAGLPYDTVGTLIEKTQPYEFGEVKNVQLPPTNGTKPVARRAPTSTRKRPASPVAKRRGMARSQRKRT